MAGKRILFLHPNFPGQFKNISKELAIDNDVYFICQTHFGRRLSNVKLYTLKGNGSSEYLEKQKVDQKKKAQIRGMQYRSGFEKLKDHGWNPDIIISHSGWGCGLYAREIWPNSLIISYVEWWFDPVNPMLKSDNKDNYLNIGVHNVTGMWARNQVQALEIIASDRLVSPTEWQKSQLPKLVADKCEVIYDGIDIENFQPYKKKTVNNNFTITYGTRGMEPMRGFPEFIKSIPEIFKVFKNASIQIAGDDTKNYGGKYPSGYNSWKNWAIDYLQSHDLSEKINWLGYLNGDKYKEYLNNSDCHVYFTQPFVVSWSLVEAMSMNCSIIASNNGCTQEFKKYVTRKNQIRYVNHSDPSDILKAIKAIYVDKQTINMLGIRNTKYLESLKKESIFKKWRKLIGDEGLATPQKQVRMQNF